MSFFVYSGLPFYKEETYKKYVISSEKREPKPQTEKNPLSPEFDLRYSKFYFTHILMIEQSNIIWWSVITAVTVSSYDSLQQHMYSTRNVIFYKINDRIGLTHDTIEYTHDTIGLIYDRIG